LRTVQASRHATIAPAQPGDVRVCASIGPEGELFALWTARGDLPALTPTATGSGGKRRAHESPRPVAVRATRHVPEPALVTRIDELRIPYVTAQPLPGGRTLVVGSRARFRPGGADRNAVVFDADGHAVADATVGDGIVHVRSTLGGDVWVGYFDEGVFGNLGWGGLDGPDPIGRHGLNRYTADLELAWRFPSHTANPWGAIIDCYALNVSGGTAWTCYYTGFPVVRIRDGVVTHWHSDVEGPTALVVGDSRIALVGGYGDRRDLVTVGTLGDDRVHVTEERRLVLPDDRPLPRGAIVTGRGADLHILTEDAWYRLDLAQL
jgi:hypothetical protein